MCTVTFIPVKEKYFITSNRDENILRKSALPPKAYTLNRSTVIYPKDVDAGGTWIAMRENSNAVVLLNGGFKKHFPAPPYRKSRGIILLEIISSSRPLAMFNKTSLLYIEPFTLVLFEDGSLYECRWDGIDKHGKQLDKSKAHIWSSATLYDNHIIQKRESWFRNWGNINPTPSMQDILKFHLFGGDGDGHNDLRMNRNGRMLTVSVTGIEINHDKAVMNYFDLINGKLYKQELHFSFPFEV